MTKHVRNKPTWENKPRLNQQPGKPQRRISYIEKKRKTRFINTEFHDALFSCGLDNRTRRLSEREFRRQLSDEITYLSTEALSCLSRAFFGIITLVKVLFAGQNDSK